jgi:hypothetical protein
MTSCADFVRLCPPVTCGKDTAFSDVTCPANTTTVFRSAKGLKCQESRDTTCASNGTAMVVACRSAAGVPAAGVLALAAAGLASLLLAI